MLGQTVSHYRILAPSGRGERQSGFPFPHGRGWSRGAGPGEGARRWPLAVVGLLALIAASGLAWFLTPARRRRRLQPS
jgi:hypothetical protein